MMHAVNYVDLNFQQLEAMKKLAVNQLLFMHCQLSFSFSDPADAQKFAELARATTGLEPRVDEAHEDIACRIIQASFGQYDIEVKRLERAIVRELDKMKGR